MPQQQRPPQQFPQQQMSPGYGASTPPAPAPARNGLGIAALVCGIAGVVLSPTIALGILLGIAGIVLGVLAIRNPRRGMPIAGISCGAAGIVISLVLWAVGWSIFGPFVPLRVARDTPDTNALAFTVTSSVRDRLEHPYRVSNDQLTFEISDISFDNDGNLIVSYYMYCGAEVDYLRFTPVEDSWNVNDSQVTPNSFNYYFGDYEHTDYFYIPAEQLERIDGIESIFSLRGSFQCETMRDGNVESTTTYDIVL
jgi:hypothetical protein